MKPVEHHRTHTIHLTEDDSMIGTETLCGIELPVAPNSIKGDGEICNNCINQVCS